MKKIFLQCSTKVAKSNIRRESINGVEHIIITSYTLPSDIVMNGGFYPKEERDKSYKTLNRTLAPIEHPQDENGNFISASDPLAISNYYAGVFNDNAEIDGERIRLEKFINVQEARKSDRGKRLLDRIEEIETSENPRPIHTSVGVFLEQQVLDEPAVNSSGDEYFWIGSNFIFDHDAILLDSVGAAQPHQGVGIGVNHAGEEIEVSKFVLNDQQEKDFTFASNDQKWVEFAAVARWKEFASDEDYPKGFLCSNEKLPFVDVINGEAFAIPKALEEILVNLDNIKVSEEEKERIQDVVFEKLGLKPVINSLKNSEMSFYEITRKIIAKLNPGDDFLYYIEEVWNDHFVYGAGDKFFLQEYEVLDGKIEFVGVATVVERKTTFNPVNNQKGDAMRELMLNALKSAGISVNADISDADLLAEYSKLQANQSGNGSDDNGNDNSSDLEAVVANALKPIAERLESMETKLAANSSAERSQKVDIIVNSGKYPEMSKEEVEALPDSVLEKFAANCSTSYGIPLSSPSVNSNADAWNSFKMPE